MADKWLAWSGPFTAGSRQALNDRQMATLKRAICDKKWLAMLPFLPFVALTETTNGPFMSCLLGGHFGCTLLANETLVFRNRQGISGQAPTAPVTNDTLFIPGRTETHPMAGRLNLLVCRFSNDHSKRKAFRKSLTGPWQEQDETPPINSTPHTWQSGRDIVLNGTSIPYILLWSKLSISFKLY